MKYGDIKNIELFLLDMDGTIYVEDNLINGAHEFFSELKKQGKEYVFITNNSSKNVTTYLKKLHNLGITATEKNLFTSSQATAVHLNSIKKNANLYVVGTNDFKEELKRYEFNIKNDISENYSIDYVVVGFDTELNYEKIINACYLIGRGVPFIATNPDLICPVSDGKFIPDCGSICQMITNATGIDPIYIGKPRREMVDIVAKNKNISLNKMAVIGDRLYTDIATGINAGIMSICVLTGETTLEMLNTSEYQPTYVMNSIYDIYEKLIK